MHLEMLCRSLSSCVDILKRSSKAVLDDHSNDAARATELLVSKLLHCPSEVLREMAVNGKTEIKDAEQLIACSV